MEKNEFEIEQEKYMQRSYKMNHPLFLIASGLCSLMAASILSDNSVWLTVAAIMSGVPGLALVINAYPLIKAAMKHHEQTRR